ncbi:protein furry [Bacillus rossius redtenbacheri]|uniref:protein furry n=1 Tax=Bacillus rossius redtenbacheri TaxID=93214 RepID=UPI002FDD3DFB
MTWIFTKSWKRDWDIAESKQQYVESLKENIVFGQAEDQDAPPSTAGGSPEGDTCGQDGSAGTGQDVADRSSLGHSVEFSHSASKDADTLASSSANTETAGSQTGSVSTGTVLPWGAHKERSPYPPCVNIDMDIRPGEFVMRTLFADFTVQAEKKMEAIMAESLEKPLSKILQRGEDPQFDQLLTAFGSVAEHCLPSILRALFAWYERQLADGGATEQKKVDQKGKTSEMVERSEADVLQERRDLAVEFIFCLVLIEVLKQLPFHPGQDDLVTYIENIAFRHFKYREGVQGGLNAANIHIIADLYAEVIGALAQSRFMSVRKKFMSELKELKSKEPSPNTTQSIISLLMGMKFFRVKMVPIEEFEASFQFMQECAQYFLEVKDKDIKHALAGLFVEILVPVAATVKNEVNVPCLKNFVEMLYSQTLDMCTKSKHRLALFPLVTCLLCVSQKTFFLQNWHYFLAMCLSHLKNRDPKMCRVALESLYRLLWVYMIRIKCESNSATQSRLQSIVNSLFPKGSKTVVPRDTPLNIFVKIIQFIAQERLDFAMREIVFDLLSVGRPIKIILTPERMSIGLRAFLVVADSLQQKEGEPPMPRTMGVLPSGNTLRVKKTFLNKMLTEDTARSIGMSSYFPHVRRAFMDILRALDAHYGRPLMMTSTQNVNKEPDEMITGERKPRIDLFRTCVAAVPRLIPDGMSRVELVDLLARLTVHMDEELRGLAYQSLQTLVMDFPDWRQDVVCGFTQFLAKDVQDTFPQLVENGLRMLLQLLTSWKNALSPSLPLARVSKDTCGLGDGARAPARDVVGAKKMEHSMKAEPVGSVFHMVEALALVMLCNYRASLRRLSVHVLREAKTLLRALGRADDDDGGRPVVDVVDGCCPQVLEGCLGLLPPAEKAAALSASVVDLQWIVDRNPCIWTGIQDENSSKSSSSLNLNGADPWSTCLFGFLERGRVLTLCPSAVVHSWPIVYTRVNALFAVVDPTPVNDNRASLLRGSTTVKKPATERDMYMHTWKNYVTFAFRVVPPVPSPIVRCASPDLSLSGQEIEPLKSGMLSRSVENLVQQSQTLGRMATAQYRNRHKRSSSSPDSLSAERTDNKSPGSSVTPSGLYKLVVPLLRCETADVRDSAVNALGKVNAEALKDLMEELLVYVREAIDRKQENMRRRRRRDALRLQLVRVFELLAEYGTLGISSCVVDRDTQSLHPTFVEYMDGARQYLESEADKDSPVVRDIKLHFCNFIRKMVKSFSLETCRTLLKRDLRRNLFNLFAQWSGPFHRPFDSLPAPQDAEERPCSELQLSALQAMTALLCCGPCFDPQGLSEDGVFYPWLDLLLASQDDKIYQLATETVVLLLECNPDIGPLLDWVVDRCYTAAPEVADGCFLALAAIFSAREYPCDHYTAVINVTLMSTGCPRTVVHETALQLLQVLDKRFFGSVGPLPAEGEAPGGDKGRDTLDLLLSTTYCRSQMYLSRQLAQLHPELTMPMFSEVTCRLQTARPELRQLLLQYLLPWLHNMELVDPSVPPANPLSYFQYYATEVSRSGGRREGWGSAEATEMVLNNLFFITAKFSDQHPKETEEVWATLCSCWPNNLKVIIRYLLIVCFMAPHELLPYAKRVAVHLARARPDRLLDEMMAELQTVETLSWLIERTETPPFYRLAAVRKTSSHSDGAGGAGAQDQGSRAELAVEKGTIHTKRHSGEDPARTGTSSKSDSALRALSGFTPSHAEKTRTASGPPVLSDDLSTPTTEPELQVVEDDYCSRTGIDKFDIPQPHPLPMPEYGGYFAPLTMFLPDTSQPISNFHRCNVAVMLLTDVVVDGVEVDWSIHVPLMLHILFLGMDHSRPLVHEHCKQLLLNLLVVLADHGDHLAVARVLLNSKTAQLGLGLPTPVLPVLPHTFTEPNPEFDSYLQGPIPSSATNSTVALPAGSGSPAFVPPAAGDSCLVPMVPAVGSGVPPVIVTPEDSSTWAGLQPGLNMPIQDVIKSLIDFLANNWKHTTKTRKMSCVGQEKQGELREICWSRERENPVFRRQGYVTELLLTLEAAVDSLESDFRPLDFMKEIFKSTPNLNNKESGVAVAVAGGKRGPGCGPGGVGGGAVPVGVQQAGQAGHTRSTSYSVSYCMRKATGSPAADSKDGRGRTSSELEARPGCNLNKYSTNLSRSRSAQSLKLLGDSATQDDKMTILAQLFWLSVSLLGSDYEHEFLLVLRLLGRVLHRLPLDRPDARDKVDKLQAQLKWAAFPGVHALLLKGCTNPNTYEPVVQLLSQFTLLLDLPVVDPSQSLAFPMNVVALLPYLLLNYEDANELCIRSAENIAQVSTEKSKKLENLATVMTLYSRRTFSKESFQWTKCVVKYLYDTYAHLSLHMLAFLVEVLEKGPAIVQLPILSIIHCMLHYVDLASAAAQPINADLLRVIAKYIEGPHFKEALKILKLVVTRSSTLVAPPTSLHPSHWDTSRHSSHPSFAESEVFMKKELPGRTMEFTFDLSQTPVIGRRFLVKADERSSAGSSGPSASPRRSVSLSPADNASVAGWKRPWMSQGRVRECLVNLLTTCGQRVGLPKSPSVIFSQNSDLIERQSSMASSTEEVSGPINDLSGGSRRDDGATEQFGVFKDFDFLEYESESVEGESTDNFNWGVRRRPLSEGEPDHEQSLRQLEESISEKTPVLGKRRRRGAEESSDDEVESESPLDEMVVAPEFGVSSAAGSGVYPPSTLVLRERGRRDSGTRSDTSGSSAGDLGDVTPCNASPNLSALMAYPPMLRDDSEEIWRLQIQGLLGQAATDPLEIFHLLHKLMKDTCGKAVAMTQEACHYLGGGGGARSPSPGSALLSSCLAALSELLTGQAELPHVWVGFHSSSPRLNELLRFGMLEIQEHRETFLDRKDHALECLDAVKAMVKLQLLGEGLSSEELVLDLGRALYKLHFQLLLLIEASNKMVAAIAATAHANNLQDASVEVAAVKAGLVRAVEEGAGSGLGTPTPPSSAGPAPALDQLEASLLELLQAEKWTATLRFVSRNRALLFSEVLPCNQDEDDITSILNIYCRHLAHKKPDIFVVTRTEQDLNDTFSQLMDSLFQVLAAVNGLDSQLREQREHSEVTLRKTEC